MMKFVLIAAGGALGALSRYTLSGWVQRLSDHPFPWGTLTVNVTGCVLMGTLMGWFAGPQLVREEYRIAVLVGFLGALTTFSSFGWETIALVNDREFGLAALNVVLNNALCLGAVWFSYRLAEKWFGV